MIAKHEPHANLPPHDISALVIEGEELEREFAVLAKALAHPVRVRIVKLLQDREDCICGDIVDELPLAQSTVSQHLKVLREAGFVSATSDGPRMMYNLKEETFTRFRALVEVL